MSESSSRSSVALGVIAALNPILVLVVGFYLNRQVSENSKQISDLKSATEINALSLQQQIDKSKVISTFLDDLVGPDGLRKKLAIEAILIVMPEEGVRFVKVVEKDDTAAAPQIKAAINSRSARLVEDLFSTVQAQRLAALTSLRRNFLDDPVTLDLLATRGLEEVKARQAQHDKDSDQVEDSGATAGLYNAVAFFGGARAPSDDANLRSHVREFLVKVQLVGSPMTKALAVSTLSRFN